jgi:outer membrane lipoprotein-sorting protein
MGTTMLVYDYKENEDDMWIYLPALRKTRRIVSSEKAKSFMGTEFSNADMSRPNMDDFSYKLLGSETVNGKDCWKVETKCLNEDIEDQNGFSRKVVYVEKSTYLAQRMEYYDLDDELFKVMTIGDYRKQSNGSYFAYSMTMENLQTNRKSVMQVDKFQLGSSLSESSFSAAKLGT